MSLFLLSLVIVLVISMSCSADVTIKFALSKNEESVRPAIEKFEELNPGINVEYERLANEADEYMRAMDLLLLGGDRIDIVWQKSLPEHWERASKEVFEPLNPYFEEENIKYSEAYSMDIRNQKGELYGLPFDPIVDTVFINKSHLDEAGLPIPDIDWSWEDYREYSKKLSKGEGTDKQYGSVWTTWEDPVHSYLVMYMVKDGTPLFYDEDTHALDHPELREWLKYRYTLENVDNSQVPYFLQKSQGISDFRYYLNGEASMYPIGPWVYGMTNNTEKFPHNFKTVIRPMPGWKDNPAGRSRSAAGVLTVNKLSPHKEEAYKFIRFMTGQGSTLTGRIPTTKDVDQTEVVKLLLGEDLKAAEKLWDVDSVIETFNSDMTLVARDVFPEEESEIREIFYQAQEKYLVGGETIEEVVEEMIREADKVMKE